MDREEKPAYDPPQKLLDFLAEPPPRVVNSAMADCFFGQYGYSGRFEFKCISIILSLLAAAVAAFAVWRIAAHSGPSSYFASRSASSVWLLGLLMVIASY